MDQGLSEINFENKNDDAIKSQKLFRVFHVKILLRKIKVLVVLKHLIKQRTQAANKLIKFYHFIKSVQQKRALFINRIIYLRAIKVSLIQSNVRSYFYRKKVHLIIEKLKNYFCIQCKIKNANKVSIKVYLKDNKTKLFDFEYCNILKIFVLYIPKEEVKGTTFKVNFFADGKIVIDPTFKTDYDRQGNFYNIINFSKIEHEEIHQMEEKNILLDYYKKKYIKLQEFEQFILQRESKLAFDCKDEINSSSEDDDGDSVEAKKSKNLTTLKNSRMSLDYSSKLKIQTFNNVNSKLGKYNKSVLNLYTPKSILRCPGSSKENLRPKRVSFSTLVNFS